MIKIYYADCINDISVVVNSDMKDSDKVEKVQKLLVDFAHKMMG